MKITPKLKEYLVANCDIKEDAGDDVFTKAVADALIDGTLTAEKYVELTKDKEDEEAEGFAKQFAAMTASLSKLTEQLAPKSDDETAKKEAAEKAIMDKVAADKKAAEEKAALETKEPSRLAKAVASIGGTPKEFSNTIDVRVKEASEQYSDTKSTPTYPKESRQGTPHPLAGQPVKQNGIVMDGVSDLGKACAGAFAKFQLMSAIPKFGGNRHAAWDRLNDHEKSLLCYTADKGEWDDSYEGANKQQYDRRCKGYPGGGGIKALIDDTTSGGEEAVPVVFDDMVIETPLLYGELFPLVNTITLPRGHFVNAVAVENITMTWGGVDATAITLFDTSGYVTAFDTTIHRVQGAVQIGLDFVSDTPINFASIITNQYGEALLKQLDDQICTGDGLIEPEGIMNHAGITDVAFGAATSLDNYESLMFTVPKQELQGSVRSSVVFCGNQTSYERSRGISVSATDERRIFGYNYQSYNIMDWPYKINETLANTQIFYAVMKRYRMYRRKGLSIQTTTEGQTLKLANEMLVLMTARYGGQYERTEPVALTTTAEA